MERYFRVNMWKDGRRVKSKGSSGCKVSYVLESCRDVPNIVGTTLEAMMLALK